MATKLVPLALVLGACTTESAPPTLQGLVELATVTGGNNQPFAHANFTDALYGPVVGEDGACTVHDALVTGPMFSAGDISIGGTSSHITLRPEGVAPSVHYDADPAPAFPSGAMINFNISGAGDVPPSVAQLFMPGPLLGFTAPPTFSRAGFTASWTRGTGGITLRLATPAYLVECHADDTGSFTIPASTFALLPSSETTAQLLIGRSAAASTGTVDVVITSQVSSYLLTDAAPLTP